MALLDNVIFNKTTLPATMKSLDASMLRARVISNNIANVNTPGYQRVEVSFEDELRTALNRSSVRGVTTNAKHFPLGRKDISAINPQISKPIDATQPSGVNNVDIDHEMAKLAENQILYNYSAKFAKGTFTKLNSAIQGRSIPSD